MGFRRPVKVAEPSSDWSGVASGDDGDDGKGDDSDSPVGVLNVLARFNS